MKGRIFEISNFIKDDTTDDKKYIDLLLEKRIGIIKTKNIIFFTITLLFQKK